MRIFLMRHAEAQPKEEVDEDEDRTLTEKGLKRMRKAGRGLRRLEMFPARILSSPVKRCLQTAEIVADELGFTEGVEAVDELGPDASPEDMVDVLRDLHIDEIVLIGHQPFMGQLIALLIGAGENARIGVKKGGLARVDVEDWGEDPPGQLRMLVSAKQLGWMKKKKKKDGGDEGLGVE